MKNSLIVIVAIICSTILIIASKENYHFMPLVVGAIGLFLCKGFASDENKSE